MPTLDDHTGTLHRLRNDWRSPRRACYTRRPANSDAARPGACRTPRRQLFTLPDCIACLAKPAATREKTITIASSTDHRRRTNRAGKLEVVLRSRWQRQSCHRRHWWQTETGGFLDSTKPRRSQKPVALVPRSRHISIIWDEEGKEV